MIRELEKYYKKLCDLYARGYVAYSDLERVKVDAPDIWRNQGQLRVLRRKLFWSGRITEFLKLRKIVKKTRCFLMKRDEMNREFIQREQKKPYVVEGNRLDPQQIAAVVVSEMAELILAPAGSGKSASLLAKINYIVEVMKIPAEKVLIIAFTRKVVEELKERVGGTAVEICTFHSLGNKIIKNCRNGEKELVTEGTLERIVSEVLEKMRSRREICDQDAQEFGDLEKLEHLVSTVISLQKNEQINLDELYKRFCEMNDDGDKKKALKFFEWYKKVFHEYERFLRENGVYDFADMLSLATEIIKEMRDGEMPYKYILVDEVQDLSRSKYLLLRAILDKCVDVKLFAVGDDWQSIYRFAGSNLNVLKDFEEIFGRKTYRGLIELTYRFGQPTAWISGKFIQKNPHQSRKRVRTFRKEKTPVDVLINTVMKKGVPRDYAMVNAELRELYRKMGEKLLKKRLQVIARYNRDLYRLVDAETGEYENAKIVSMAEEGVVLKWKIASEVELELAFCSMHKSKGITRDIVFVINMNAGDKGMPATRPDDAISAVLLAKLDPYPLAEERRLFYVAMTRAVERTVIVCESGNVSDFVFEIGPFLDAETAEILAEERKKMRLKQKKMKKKH